jgi:sulfur carrier protein ThiS
MKELTMGKASTVERQIEVTLMRTETGARSFTVPEGATLADLLREAGASADGAKITIDGRPIEDLVSLNSGMVVTILPAVPGVPANGGWRDTVGTIQDTAAFREMIAAGRELREAEREAARNQTEQNGS